MNINMTKHRLSWWHVIAEVKGQMILKIEKLSSSFYHFLPFFLPFFYCLFSVLFTLLPPLPHSYFYLLFLFFIPFVSFALFPFVFFSSHLHLQPQQFTLFLSLMILQLLPHLLHFFVFLFQNLRHFRVFDFHWNNNTFDKVFQGGYCSSTLEESVWPSYSDWRPCSPPTPLLSCTAVSQPLTPPGVCAALCLFLWANAAPRPVPPEDKRNASQDRF